MPCGFNSCRNDFYRRDRFGFGIGIGAGFIVDRGFDSYGCRRCGPPHFGGYRRGFGPGFGGRFY